MTAKKVKDVAVKADAPIKKATKKADKITPAKAIVPGSKKDVRQQIDTALAMAMGGMQQHFKEKEYVQLLKKAGKLFGDALQVTAAKAPAKPKAKSKIVVAKKKDKGGNPAAPAAE